MTGAQFETMRLYLIILSVVYRLAVMPTYLQVVLSFLFTSRIELNFQFFLHVIQFYFGIKAINLPVFSLNLFCFILKQRLFLPLKYFLIKKQERLPQFSFRRGRIVVFNFRERRILSLPPLNILNNLFFEKL